MQDKYYLYAAHPERIKSSRKVKRVCDGYLGRITKEEDFIPAKSKLNNLPDIFEIGLSYVVVYASEQIHLGLLRSFTKYWDVVYFCSVLSYIYGEYSKELFGHSYLCILFLISLFLTAL